MIRVSNKLSSYNINSSIFSVFKYSLKLNFSFIIANIKKTNRLVIFDDSKSINKVSEKLINYVRLKYPNLLIVNFTRPINSIKPSPNNDTYQISTKKINQLIAKVIKK